MLIIFGIIQHRKIFQSLYIVPTEKSSIIRINLSNMEIEIARIKTMETEMYKHIRASDRGNLDKVMGALTPEWFQVKLRGLATITSHYDHILVQVDSGKRYEDIGKHITRMSNADARLIAAEPMRAQYLFNINGTKIDIAYSPKSVESTMPECNF